MKILELENEPLSKLRGMAKTLNITIWGVWQHGFPEFTRAGIIRGAGAPPE